MICFRVFIALFIGISTIQGQVGYQPLLENEDFRTAVLADMEQRFQDDLTKIRGDHKKKIKKHYTTRYEGLRKRMENGHFITDESLNDYFNDILSTIIDANPLLKNKQLRLLISRYTWPNATCHGEGTIVLNLGLISRLENESQLAFVICHELAHDYLNHVNKAIRKNVLKLNSKATKKRLKKIKKGEYNSYEKALKLLNSLTFDQRKHSRLHEEEADSMALVFMQPTPYDTREAAKCLAIFDKIDQPKRQGFIDFKKHFDWENFQIKDRWLTIEEGSGFNYNADKDQNLLDSLKTHPDCQKRIKAIESMIASNEKAPIEESKYRAYIHLADYEMVESMYLFGEYGKALFHAFLLVEEYPDDVYLHTMIVNCLYQLANHQKEHELGKVLSLPDPRFDENYNQLLNFIHNLRFRDLCKLGHQYALKNMATFSNNEAFRAAHVYSAALNQKAAEWRSTQQTFLKDFPEGDYSEAIKEFKPDF